jgi:hypothetical protein
MYCTNHSLVVGAIMISIAEIRGSWFVLLVDTELAKNYKIANMLAGRGHVPAPNPILDALLPSLLYVRLGAFLDEAFEEYVNAAGMVMGKPYRGDLNGRIAFLNDQGKLVDAAKLHALRLKRNELAHESSRSCKWSDLDEAIHVADAELQHLGLVGPRPKFEFYAERNPKSPTEPGYIMSHEYCYGLRVGSEKVAEVSWTVNIGMPGK